MVHCLSLSATVVYSIQADTEFVYRRL